jgi:mono/diheme cytochrome c family protein
MKGRWFFAVALFAALLLTGSLLCFAKDYGKWLTKVPQADRERVNPYAGKPEAVAAGANLYRDNCAKCHGENGEGRPGRPSLRGEDVRNATDGDLAWILKNGQMFQGMPSWGGLPEQERWQLVAYLRSLNMPDPGQQATPAGAPSAGAR